MRGERRKETFSLIFLISKLPSFSRKSKRKERKKEKGEERKKGTEKAPFSLLHLPALLLLLMRRKKGKGRGRG